MLDMCILVQIHMAKCFSRVHDKAHNCKTFPTPPKEPAVTAAERQMPVAISAWLAIFQVTVYPGKRFPCCLQCHWLPKAREFLGWNLYLDSWGISVPCISVRGIWDQSAFSHLLILLFPSACTCVFPVHEYPEGMGKRLALYGFGKPPSPYFCGLPFAGLLP